MTYGPDPRAKKDVIPDALPSCRVGGRVAAGTLCRAASLGIYSGPIWSELSEATCVDWPDRLGKKVLCYLNLEDKRHGSGMAAWA
jgi:hypothetical protein